MIIYKLVSLLIIKNSIAIKKIKEYSCRYPLISIVKAVILSHKVEQIGCLFF